MQINNKLSKIALLISMIGIPNNIYASSYEDSPKEQNKKPSTGHQTSTPSTFSYINPFNLFSWFLSSETGNVESNISSKDDKTTEEIISNNDTPPSTPLNVTINNELLEQYAIKHGRAVEDLMKSICLNTSKVTTAIDEEGNHFIALPNYSGDFLGYLNNEDAPRMPIYAAYTYNVRVSNSKKPWKHVHGNKLWAYYNNNPNSTFKFTQVKYEAHILYSILAN